MNELLKLNGMMIKNDVDNDVFLAVAKHKLTFALKLTLMLTLRQRLKLMLKLTRG